MPDGSLVRVADLQRHAPRPHQQRALDDVIAELKQADRTTLVMACGTGKTLVGMLAAADATRDEGGIVVALFPSLALISQTVPEWLRHWPHDDKFRYMVVCSDPTVAGSDEITPDPATLPFDVTTDPEQVEAFLRTKREGQTLVVFVTYQSAAIVGQALSAAGKKADFTVFDEAHRTAGAKDSTFGIALHDRHFPARRRLFMTATPRITKRLERNKNGDAPVISMDDEALYGRIAHRYTFRQAAVEDKIICRYQVIVSHVTRSELPGGVPEEEAAALVALKKAIEKLGAVKVISYHQDIQAARRFADDAASYIPYLDVVHVNGAQSSFDRDALMDRFERAQKALATNAKCLTEGVDVPAIDMVAFMSRKKSTIDIVQAVGRALRRNGTKEVGYVLVPLLMDIESGETVEHAFTRQKQKELWSILSSLMDEDDDLSQSIAARARRQKTSSRLPVTVLSDVINPDQLQNAVGVQIIERLSESFDRKFPALLRYVARTGSAYVPVSHIEGGFNLGEWCAHLRRDFSLGTISPQRYEALSKLPGWKWDLTEDKFLQGMCVLRTYIARTGTAHVPKEHIENGFPLGSWCASRRREFAAGILSPEKEARLTSLPEWDWNRFDTGFAKGLAALHAYVARTGTSNVPDPHVEDGFNLGNWCASRRTEYKIGSLTAERISKLEALPGWKWDRTVDSFSAGIQALTAYVNRTGNARVPSKHKEDGFDLGRWCIYCRTRLKKGKLSQEKIALLESFPGWSWDINEQNFLSGIDALRSYASRTGTVIVAQRHVENNFNLGTWCQKQRDAYHAGTLTADRISRLEALPGWAWNMLDHQFDRGLSALKAYTARTGRASPPQGYLEDGFRLGDWCSSRRVDFASGRLPPARAALLESLPGWFWSPQEKRFSEGFPVLEAYVARTGSASMRVKQIEGGFHLGAWCRYCRQKFSEGQLSAENITKLEAITGWTWNMEKLR